MISAIPRYLTLTRFKQAILVDDPDAIDSINDPIYTEIIVGVEAAIDLHCDRSFEPALAPGAETQKVYDLRPYGTMYIDDVVAITTISVYGVPITAPEWRLITRGAYSEGVGRDRAWSRIRRFDLLGNPIEWTSPFVGSILGGLTVTGRWGFEPITPPEVVSITLKMCVASYESMPYAFLTRDEPDLVGSGVAPAIIFTPDIIEMLSNLVRPPLGDVV